LPIIGPESGKFLAEIVQRAKPKRVLEVGCLVGYSTILIAKELEADAEIISIEIDRDEAEVAKQNLRDAGVKPKVQILVGDASELIPKLNGSFDLVFLDEDKHEYFRPIRLIEDNLHEGSIVIVDNAGAYAFSMRNYLDYVRKSGKCESRYVPAGTDGLEVSTKL